MKKVLALTLALSLLLTMGLVVSAQAGQLKKVTLSGHPSPHTTPAIYAKSQGWFEEEGLDVDLLIYISGPPQMEAVPSGAWQVGSAGTPATITGVLGFDNKMLGFGLWDHPAMALFARPDSPIVKRGKGHIPGHPEVYGKPEDYKGLKILGPRGTLGHLMVMASLKAIGLTEDDVEIVHMEIPAAFQAFKAGQGDAAMTWSTFTAQGFDEGWVEITSANKIDFPIPAIISATEKMYETDPETIQKIMNVWVRAAYYQQSHKEELTKMYEKVCQDEGIASSPAFCKFIVDLHDVPPIEQMEEWIATGGHERILGRIMDFYVSTGAYTEAEKEKILGSFDTSFLKKALENYRKKYM